MNNLLRFAASLSLVLSSFVFFSCGDDSDAIGLNDAAKYGNIMVTYEGTRPDGIAFTEKMNYRFTPEESFSTSSFQTDDDYYYFEVERHHGAVNNNHNENYVALYLTVDTSGDEPEFLGPQFYVYTNILIEDDKKFFYLSNYINPTPEEITTYDFNPETGKLKVKFTATSDAEANATNHDLKVTVEISATVFESLNDK